MRCFIGIDLGSTTTKAVVIDEARNVLGRGITNSRSNYDAAAERFCLIIWKYDSSRFLMLAAEK